MKGDGAVDRDCPVLVAFAVGDHNRNPWRSLEIPQPAADNGSEPERCVEDRERDGPCLGATLRGAGREDAVATFVEERLEAGGIHRLLVRPGPAQRTVRSAVARFLKDM